MIIAMVVMMMAMVNDFNNDRNNDDNDGNDDGNGGNDDGNGGNDDGNGGNDNINDRNDDSLQWREMYAKNYKENCSPNRVNCDVNGLVNIRLRHSSSLVCGILISCRHEDEHF